MLIYQIIGLLETHNSDKENNNNNQAKIESQMSIIARLLLGGENQADVALKLGYSQSTISDKWSKFRDKINILYTEKKLLKKEIASEMRARRKETLELNIYTANRGIIEWFKQRSHKNKERYRVSAR